MKTIYESILSSTNSGKEKIVSGLKNWVVENLNYTVGNLFKVNKLYGIDVKVKNGGYSINVNTGWDGDFFRFDSWVKDTEKYVHSVKDIKINNKAVNVYYAGINFSKTDSFVDEVHERLVLSGGEFEIINKLPKNCRKIFFDCCGLGKNTTTEGSTLLSLKNSSSIALASSVNIRAPFSNAEYPNIPSVISILLRTVMFFILLSMHESVEYPLEC